MYLCTSFSLQTQLVKANTSFTESETKKNIQHAWIFMHENRVTLSMIEVEGRGLMNFGCQCYLQDIDLELAALEEGNRNRQAELSAYAELDNIADEDEQEPPGIFFSRNDLYR